MRGVGWLAMMAVLGCTGEVKEPTVTPRGPMGLDCRASADVADPGPTRRLSEAQYLNTVRELAARFGATVNPESPFPSREQGGTFSSSYLSNTVSRTTAEAMMDRAEIVSEAMVADLGTLLGCAPSGAPSDSCVAGFVDRFAPIAFRRPITDEERASLVGVYDTLVAQIGPTDAVRAILEVALQSPLFLYIDGGEVLVESGREPFEAYALANRLSYFLWDSMPDEALFAAAESGALMEPDALRAEVERMVSDPRARAVVRSFHAEWMRVLDPAELRPSAEDYPGFSPEIAESIAEESARLVDATVWDGPGTFTDLLSRRTAFVDANTAALYGVTPEAYGPDGWGEVELPADRRGVLTRAHFMASHRPIFRGTTLIDRLLCLPLEVPANIDTTLREPSGTTGPLTPREIFEMHSENPNCASCHHIIDPIGFSFEHYGADGAYRAEYANGLAIATRGAIETPRAIRFDDGGELIDALAEEPLVHGCYAERYVEWAIGRGLTRDERCASRELSDPSEPLSIRELIVQIATSDVMRYRGPVSEGGP